MMRGLKARQRVLRPAVSPPLTPGRVLWLTRTSIARGLSTLRWDLLVSGDILGACRNPYAGEPAAPVPVHVVGGINQGLIGFWMLASWFATTGRNWSVNWHDDGSLTPVAIAALEQCFPGIRIIRKSDADRMMEPQLSSRPACADYRARLPLGLKIFDVPTVAEGERFILLDTDLMFFTEPTEILAWAA